LNIRVVWFSHTIKYWLVFFPEFGCHLVDAWIHWLSLYIDYLNDIHFDIYDTYIDIISPYLGTRLENGNYSQDVPSWARYFLYMLHELENWINLFEGIRARFIGFREYWRNLIFILF
jgi:hypothetical protein